MEEQDNGTNMSKKSAKNDENQSSDSACGSDRKPLKGNTGGKRLKKDDSGINVMPESDNSDDLSDSGANSSCENTVLKNSSQSEPNSPDSGNLESSCSTGIEPKVSEKGSFRTFEEAIHSDLSIDSDDEVLQVKPVESSATSNCDVSKKSKKSKQRNKRKSPDTSDDDEDDDDDNDDEEKRRKKKEAEDKKYDPTPSTKRPVHLWSAPKAILSRQYGLSKNYSPDLFRYDCYGSLHMVERLELMYKMKKHDGCVNALNFNTTGTKLVTGSDDLDVVIWNWATSEPILDYSSGHTSNVFQVNIIYVIS